VPPSAPATVATATHLLPFVLVAARPRRAAANAQTMPVDDRQRERCAAAASRVQNAFATCAEWTPSRARSRQRSRGAVVNALHSLYHALLSYWKSLWLPLFQK